MQNNVEKISETRKPWTTPEYRHISAGSAENGSGTIADGGGPGANRS
jgi:hypothetical protein